MPLNAVRAWKDEAYHLNLDAEERDLLPENPVGEVELNDVDLEAIYGGKDQPSIHSLLVCIEAPVTITIQAPITSLTVLGAIMGDCKGDNKIAPRINA